jgi:hypothetical protein
MKFRVRRCSPKGLDCFAPLAMTPCLISRISGEALEGDGIRNGKTVK